MTVSTEESSRCIASVKWFNGKQGYGFLSCVTGDRIGEDVFVHHTSLQTEEDVYRYLVQGEYVEFNWSEVNETERWHAVNVTGINRGKLMCQTRSENRAEQSIDDDGHRRRKRRAPKARGGGPRDEDGEWTTVKGKSRKETKNVEQDSNAQ